MFGVGIAGAAIAFGPSVAVSQPPGVKGPLPQPPDSRRGAEVSLSDEVATPRDSSRFVEPLEQAQESLTLQVGHPRILQFREAPLRVHLPDEETVTLDILDGEEGRIVSVTGQETGSTTLTLWFRDPESASGTSVVSYRVQVTEDPDRTARFEQLLADLEHDLNRSFPNSVVRLSYVGSEVLVRGKAKDIEEATQILRIVSRSIPTDDQEERVRDFEGALEDELGTGGAAAQDATRTLLPLGDFFEPGVF